MAQKEKIKVDFCSYISYNIITVKENLNKCDRQVVRKEKKMDEEMNVGELLKETAEENQTRKILEILNECKDLEEAKKKVKALLNK